MVSLTVAGVVTTIVSVDVVSVLVVEVWVVLVSVMTPEITAFFDCPF